MTAGEGRKEKMYRLLAADIGGTHSRFAYFILEDDGNLHLMDLIWFPTRASSSFGELLSNLKKTAFPLLPEEADMVGLAIAGPVKGGVFSHPPFIPWEIDLSRAHHDFGFRRFFLINDFVAQAYGCLSPAGKKVEIIHRGEPVEEAPLGVLGGGTGFGKAILIPLPNGRFLALPSEGGHGAFPLVRREEWAFREFLLKTEGSHYVTINQVLSGRGVVALFEFLTGQHFTPEEAEVRLKSESVVLLWLARFFGRVVRDFALSLLLMRGVYIAGGVAVRNPEIVHHSAFLEEFLSSSTMREVLTAIPLYLLKDENSGLWGVAQKAKEELAL